MERKGFWKSLALLGLAAAGGVLFLLSCTLSGGGGTPVVMTGRMTKGSVIVNGVEFHVSASTSIRKDGAAGTEAELQDGMIVKLRGTVNADGVTGEAEKVNAEDEVQGNVSSLSASANPQSLVVLSQTIYVDDHTMYAGGLANFSSLAVTDLVEVHGQREAAGGIHATRIEKLTSGEVELKGTVSALGATTFTIGTQTVNFSAATLDPSGASLANGQRVEARGVIAAGTLNATLVTIEDLTEDPDLKVSSGMAARLEGFIANLAEPTPGTFTFTLNGQDVSTTASTEFKGGSSANLANDVKVEVKGTSDGSSLVAAEVEFSDMRVELEGTVSAHSSTSLTIFGLAVALNDLTEGSGGIVDAQRYKVEGYLAGSTLTAEKVSSVGGGSDRLQAPVEAEVGNPTYSLTLLGITVDLSVGGVAFKDANENPITQGAFFAAVTPGLGTAGTLVKIKGGAFNGTSIPSVTEAQLED